MARKKNGRNGASTSLPLPNHTKRAVISVVLIVLGIFLTLAAFGAAGIAGSDTYHLLQYLLGFGYFVVPLLFIVLGVVALREESAGFTALKIAASILFLVSGLGFVDMESGHGGEVGHAIAAPVERFFDIYAGSVLLAGFLLISLLVLLEGKVSLTMFSVITSPLKGLAVWLRNQFAKKGPALDGAFGTLPENDGGEEDDGNGSEAEESETDEEYSLPSSTPLVSPRATTPKRSSAEALRALLGTYNAPPLSLLEHDKGRPGVGDIKANANIIKRTLQNFGIVVELDEISIGPSVTRYAIKPAEGVRLSKIVSLQTNLELALAAHPVRIEAPIPGKSLVGIEVPNSAKVTVGLGTMLASPHFNDSSTPLVMGLGRDIAGASHFGNLAKMPHVLIAGATGSGKSVTIHALITSLIYRNGPEALRFLMIDPKRVELTLYRSLPHLLTPVMTDPKRAIVALRWAGREMQRRYDILERERVRDIESYHGTVLAPALESLRSRGGSVEDSVEIPEAMPYIVIVIDELADIMQTYPRELEAAVVRLAQMSRAVGIHLMLSTQRPSVNVITGLIKANIPSRIALQVASQIDSRTIIDTAGAEKLLGQGDMLYLSSDMGKPMRLQSAFVSETEVKRVVEYIATHNEAQLPVELNVPGAAAAEYSSGGASHSGSFSDEEEVDDDMYEAAKAAVLEAGKASTSYIQRKLRVGYARAARLMDVLEERGIIGPQDGAKPREVLSRAGEHVVESPSTNEEEV